MSKITSFAAVAALLIASAPIYADEQRDAAYILGPDDVIEITVLSHPDLNKTVTVLQDGTITYPWAGRLKAAGKSPAQLALEIQNEIEKTRNHATVSIAVKEVHSRRARIIGGVKAPGGYDLKPGWRLLDLIAVAGGLSSRPTGISGRIIRANGQVVPLRLTEAVTRPDTSANPDLQPDDLVLLDEVDPATRKVFVMGRVARPGGYDIADDGMNLLSLLSLAGGLTESAALASAYVLRGDTQIAMDLRPTVGGGPLDPKLRDFKLQATDVLFVPGIEQRIAVMGQVNKPGYYAIPEERTLTIMDALSLAGGQSPQGDLSKAGIIRVVNGSPTVTPIDIEKMMKTKELSANLPMRQDDVLFIPSKGERGFDWRNLLSPLASLGLLGIRLFR